MTVGNKAFAMKRSTADRLMEGIRERIILANLDNGFACRVERAVVFGSYVNEPERDRIGDLDLAVRLVDRYPKERMREVCMEKFREAPGHMDEVSVMFWYREEVYRFIRNRSPFIQIMDLNCNAEAVFSKGWIDLPTSPERKDEGAGEDP